MTTYYIDKWCGVTTFNNFISGHNLNVLKASRENDGESKQTHKPKEAFSISPHKGRGNNTRRVTHGVSKPFLRHDKSNRSGFILPVYMCVGWNLCIHYDTAGDIEVGAGSFVTGREIYGQKGRLGRPPTPHTHTNANF